MAKWYVRAVSGIYLTQIPDGVPLFHNYYATSTARSVMTFASKEAAEEIAEQVTANDKPDIKWHATKDPPSWLPGADTGG